jgi:hypothetical protein
MKVAWALQVTAGVTVSSFAMLPPRASAKSRGVRGPKCRGVNPTTIIASTGFNCTSSMPHFGNGFRANHSRNDLPNWQAKWHAVQKKLECALR